MVTQSFAAPSAATMYANEAITVPVSEINPLAATNVTNTDLLRAIQALVLSVAKVTVPIKVKTKYVFSSNSKSVQAYCWTHGHCAHTSVDCKRPAPGHLSSATASNPLGGNLSKWNRSNK